MPKSAIFKMSFNILLNCENIIDFTEGLYFSRGMFRIEVKTSWAGTKSECKS